MKYFSILKKQRHPLRFLWSRIIRDTGIWRFLVFKMDGYTLRFHPAALSLSLWVDRNDRSTDSDVIRLLLSSGQTYVDVGANIGHLVVEAALAVGKAGQVFAFEPHPRIAGFLRENVHLNGLKNIAVAQMALGQEFGWVILSDQRADDQNRVCVDGAGIPVPLATLDTFLPETPIHLLKVDVEGYEKFVFEGARKTLDRTQYIYFEAKESHFNHLGYTFADLYDIISGAGFSIIFIEDGQLNEVTRDRIFDDCVNLFASRNMQTLTALLNSTT
jgi:FkbM family methyltransferase